MVAVVGKRFRKDLRYRQHGSECKQVLVCLNFYCLWNRPDPPKQPGADCHSACPQKSAAPAKQARALDCTGLETKSLADNFYLFTAVELNVENPVPHNSNGCISTHGL